MIKILLTTLFIFPFLTKSIDSNMKPIELIKNKKSILIGDSNVGVIQSTKGFKSTGIIPTVCKVGISTNRLINILRGVKVDSSVTTVFVAIGTNDCYRGDRSCNLRLQLLKVYPNAKELYVIWGSRGWGGVKYSTIDQQERFYKKFESNGFNQIKVKGGYFSNMKKSHSVNGDFFIEIVNRLNDINN